MGILRGFAAGLGTWVMLTCPVAWAQSQGQSQSQNQSSSPNASDLHQTLKSAVIASQSRLGAIPGWQKRIFEEEITPNYSIFIKDYRPGPQGLQVEVDMEIVRRYLAFYGPNALKPAERKVLTLFLSPENCAKCAASEAEIANLVKARLARRGLDVVWVTPAEVPDQNLTGRSLIELLRDLAIERGVAGALVIQAKRPGVDAIDTAHADDRRLTLHTAWSLRAGVDLKHQGKLEIGDDEAMTTPVGRLLIESLTDFGARTLAAREKGDGVSVDEEFLVEVNGIRDFAHYAQVRKELLERFKGVGEAEERKNSRGRVVFAIRGKPGKPGELERTLRRPADDGSSYSVTGATDSGIQVETTR